MNKKLELKYPSLSDVLESLEVETTSFDHVIQKDNEFDDDQEYTFDTHPFYSSVGDLSELEIPDTDIY